MRKSVSHFAFREINKMVMADIDCGYFIEASSQGFEGVHAPARSDIDGALARFRDKPVDYGFLDSPAYRIARGKYSAYQ